MFDLQRYLLKHYTDNIPPTIPSAVKQTSIANPHLFIIAGDMVSLRRAQQPSMYVPRPSILPRSVVLHITTSRLPQDKKLSTHLYACPPLTVLSTHVAYFVPAHINTSFLNLSV
ncbi:unnamed protein product [Ectocarpus sp. 8 AP-2014]